MPRRDGEPDLRRTSEDVRTERDDRFLRERCLGALLDFADREGKRLVLEVENLNSMFSDMIDPNAALVDFMDAYYSRSELEEIVEEMVAAGKVPDHDEMKAVLGILPRLDSVPGGTVTSLISGSLALGIDRMKP